MRINKYCIYKSEIGGWVERKGRWGERTSQSEMATICSIDIHNHPLCKESL